MDICDAPRAIAGGQVRVGAKKETITTKGQIERRIGAALVRFPSILKVVAIVQPEALVRWHLGRLSSLLALEIELAGRVPAKRDGIARADPANEHGGPALGCATYPRRTLPFQQAPGARMMLRISAEPGRQ
jgi:hypothetical protein